MTTFWVRNQVLGSGDLQEGLDVETFHAPFPSAGIPLPAGTVSRLRVAVYANTLNVASTVVWQVDGSAVSLVQVVIPAGFVGVMENANTAPVLASMSSDFLITVGVGGTGSITLSASVQFVPSP